ncbi:CD74 molecule, major histocompatibility complex, class II invariant chain b [Antennarius striatus]|uniref:CD74 molecule, major histocompatibility complex, class II invariant chain b n=1 Tax=Antennarius striatus TaxID=241820 RepID=UPI0035B2621C
MSNNETQNEALIQEQTTFRVPPAQRGRSSSNAMVVGFTLVACVLIAGQAVIGYFLITHRNDIRGLEAQNYMMIKLAKGRSADTLARKQIRPAIAPERMTNIMDLEGFLKEQQKKSYPQATECQREASGEKPVMVPFFRPVCDEQGLYQARQCAMDYCWCVDPHTGNEISRPMSDGPVNCNISV